MKGQIQTGKNMAYSLTDDKSFDPDSVGMDLVPSG